MNKITRFVAIIGASFMLFSTHIALAACGGVDQGVTGGINCGPVSKSIPDAVKVVINTLLFIVGIASVIVIIVGGLRYVLSGGDPKNTAAAKDTILYAVIGVVVSLLAYAIVNFVLGQFR
ncbi:MAG: hypothetical protein WCI47_03225 [bacterium]